MGGGIRWLGNGFTTPGLGRIGREGELLAAMGMVDSEGHVYCRECGVGPLVRHHAGTVEHQGMDMLYLCECGWGLSQIEWE